MSLHLAAQHLAKQGRGPDSMLVHMAPREVAGLQALARAHGGSLTVNPQTGLPEAFSLRSLLPTLIGAGLTFFSGGTLSPLMAAGMVGGASALSTGSLQKGIMAGLGAYGGAGLGQGLLAAGSDAAAASAVEALPKPAVVEPTQATVGTGMTTHATPAIGGGADPYSFLKQSPLSNGDPGFRVTGDSGIQLGGVGGEGMRLNPTLRPETVTQMPSDLTTYQNSFEPTVKAAQASFQDMPAMDKLGKSFGALGTEGGRAAALEKMGGGWGAAQYGLAALAPDIAESMRPKTALYKGSGPNPYQYRYDPNPVYATPDMYGREQSYYRPLYAAEGGEVALTRDTAQGGFPQPDMQGREQRYFTPHYTEIKPAGTAESQPESGGLFSILRKALGENNTAPQYTYAAPPAAQMPFPQPDPTGRGQRYMAPSYTQLDPATGNPMAAGGTVEEMSQRNQAETTMANGGQMLAMGGVSHLGDYSDGGRLLRGPGDGVSDSIPADIEGKRPARLADGEFVVPARIVSELGNGSTEAGARKLYSMMDRVQAARSKTMGKGKVAVNSRAEKLLPA